MKKSAILALTALCAAVACNKFDDSAIWEKLNDHENRIVYLEEVCRKMNADIVNLQTLVTALESNDNIVSVSPLATGDGYTFTFSSGKSIVIYSGVNGQDGTNGKDGVDGKDGIDGKDGVTPVISVMKDTDGVYYWTVNGEWLLVNGNKVKASAEDGEDGTDGITPQFKIEDDYWYVSYDNGTSWEQLEKASGSNGLNGANGDSFFKGVSMADGYVQFTLNDENGTIIKVPYLMDETLIIICEKTDDIKLKLTNQQKRSVVHLIVKGHIDESDVRYIADQMLTLEILDLRETDLASVPDYAFCKGNLKYGKETIREVYLPEKCVSIGSCAFYGCVNLKILDAPGVVKLDVNALQYCNIGKMTAALGDVNSVKESSDCTVGKLEYGKNVTTAYSLTNTSIDTIYCHTGITAIGTFGANVKNVIFEEPASIKVIETGDFNQCGFKNFVLPASVETIQYSALSQTSLDLFVIPQNSKLNTIECSDTSGPFSYTSYDAVPNLSILCFLKKPIWVHCLFYYSTDYHFGSHRKSNGNLYVPRSCVSLYEDSHWGKDFADVIAIEDSEYANWGL